MSRIKLDEKIIFLFLAIKRPDSGDLFFMKGFFDLFEVIDSSNYEEIKNKLVDNGVLTSESTITNFGSKLGKLEFKLIRNCGSDKEKRYLNHLVKIGAFSHLERAK